MHRYIRTKLFVALVAALALSALLLAGGASAQRAPRQGNDNDAGGAKSKRVVGVRSSDTGNGSRVTITADDSLKDYSAYRSGDRFYVVLPKAAAGARGGGSGRGYSDMQVQQRGDSVVLSYRVQPGAKPRVEQKFNRLDVVFDVPGGDAGQQAATANNAARQQPQQTPPAESRNTAAQQNNQTQATPNANPTPERRQPTAEEAARAQAANSAAANTTQPAVTATQPTAPVDPSAQNPATASVEPTQAPSPAASPAAEPQLAQAQLPNAIAPITTNQPVSQPTASLGTYLIQNWWLALVVAMVVIGLGLIIAGRRTAAATAPPVESLDDSAAKLDKSRDARAKEASAKALKDASAAAEASTLGTAKASTVSTAEPVSRTETVSTAEASTTDVKPLVAATALAGGAAAAKSRKQSRKEARQEARRKKKGARADEFEQEEVPAAESTVAEPVAQESVVEELAVEEQVIAAPVAEETTAVEPVAEETLIHEETVVEAPSVEEPAVAEESVVDEKALVETPTEVEEVVQDEPAEVAQAITTKEVAEVVAESEVAESSFETLAPAHDTSEVETTEIAPVETETAEPFVAEAEPPVVSEVEAPVVSEVEAPAPVLEIEPAFAPDPERVQDETRHLLEGEEYDRAVIGSRDAMARQMIAAELLSAIAGRNMQRRERAGAAFVEHGYYDETARDLREADAPAERSAAARSLAILGDRNATPLLIAALEDPVSDVRRAAVEALGALRDPSAVEPLEALLEREKSERNRIPPRVIRSAVEFCREGFAQEPPAAEAATVEVAPVEEAAVETAPEPFADLSETEAEEETSVSITPFVDDAAEAEPIVAPEPAAEATGETAHVPEPVHTEESFESATETGVEPFVETEQSFVETEVEAAEAREEFTIGAAEEVGIQPVTEQVEEVSTAGTFDFVTERHESGQAALFDTDTEEATREIEPVAADSTKELTPSTSEVTAGEWFDFDISEMGGESQPAAEATTTPEPVSSEPSAPEAVFETSSGETLSTPAFDEVEETAAEPAPFFEATTETTREIEVADEVAEPAHVLQVPSP
jgi:hypothetical protein